MNVRARMMTGSFCLLAVAVASGAWVYLGIRAPEKREREQRDESARLVPRGFPAVDGLRIERRDESAPLVIERSEGGWMITSPVRTPADTGEVQMMLSELRALAAETVVAAPGGDRLASYGLAPPLTSITLEGEEALHGIEVGDRSPFDGRIYARAAEGPVVLLDDGARFTLGRRLHDLREKRVLRFRAAEAATVLVQLGERSYAIERDGDGAWRLGGAAGAERASASEIASLISSLQSLRAIAFPELGPGSEAAMEKVGRIVVSLAGEDAPLELLILEHLDGEVRRHLARGSGLAHLVEIPGESIRRLSRQDPIGDLSRPLEKTPRQAPR